MAERLSGGDFLSGVNGSYNPPGHKTRTVRPSHFEKDSVGVADGLSARADFDSESFIDGPDYYNYTKDPANGNASERPDPYMAKPITGKGIKFEIC